MNRRLYRLEVAMITLFIVSWVLFPVNSATRGDTQWIPLEEIKFDKDAYETTAFEGAEFTVTMTFRNARTQTITIKELVLTGIQNWVPEPKWTGSVPVAPSVEETITYEGEFPKGTNAPVIIGLGGIVEMEGGEYDIVWGTELLRLSVTAKEQIPGFPIESIVFGLFVATIVLFHKRGKGLVSRRYI